MTSNFIVYLIGYLLIIAGVAFGMSAADIDQTWIIVVVLIMAGLGIIYAFGRSQTDEATRSQRPQDKTSGSTGTTGSTGGTGSAGGAGTTSSGSSSGSSSGGPHA